MLLRSAAARRLFSVLPDPKETVHTARRILSRLDVPELARHVRTEDPVGRNEPDAKVSETNTTTTTTKTLTMLCRSSSLRWSTTTQSMPRARCNTRLSR